MGQRIPVLIIEDQIFDLSVSCGHRLHMILLPCLLILPRFFGVAGVWYSMPVSDVLASLIALVMLVMQFRKFKAAAAQVR